MYQIKHTVKNQFGYFDMEAYRTSQEQYNEEKGYKYIIKCKNCGQIYYRVRKPNNLQKYRCGVCRGKLILIVTEQYKTN